MNSKTGRAYGFYCGDCNFAYVPDSVRVMIGLRPFCHLKLKFI
eukprot:COSAG02_NODE_50785_length_318_cov_0.913242_1_plen_42_part_01